jgi:DNA processing protein
VSGSLPDATLPTVGIVGTRRFTPYGARVARELATELTSAGAVIVSGLAQGIDSTAHAASVAANGSTIAVLGEGISWFEDSGPIRRRQLAERIRQRGALISEYALDHRPSEWTYPRRNATIAALSDVVIVVEAPATSGAMITADHAIELQRPLYVVPGPLGAPTWTGSNRLIAQRKATLLTGPAEIADLLDLRLTPPAPKADLGALSERLLALLAAGPSDADTIAAGLGVGAPQTSVVIAEMLIAGRLEATGDGRFARR